MGMGAQPDWCREGTHLHGKGSQLGLRLWWRRIWLKMGLRQLLQIQERLWIAGLLVRSGNLTRHKIEYSVHLFRIPPALLAQVLSLLLEIFVVLQHLAALPPPPPGSLSWALSHSSSLLSIPLSVLSVLFSECTASHSPHSDRTPRWIKCDDA